MFFTVPLPFGAGGAKATPVGMGPDHLAQI